MNPFDALRGAGDFVFWCIEHPTSLQSIFTAWSITAMIGMIKVVLDGAKQHGDFHRSRGITRISHKDKRTGAKIK